MAQSSNQDVVLSKVQGSIVASHGVGGIKNCVRRFRSLGETAVHGTTFFDILAECGARALTAAEKKHLTLAFDDDRSGKISLTSFLRQLVLCGLNPRRRQVVKKAFQILSRGGSDADVETLLQTHQSTNASLSGTSTQILLSGTVNGTKKFESSFSPSDGKVTEEEFTAFYTGVHLSTTMSDEAFEDMVLREWAADQSQSPRLNETQRDWSGTKSGSDPLESGSQPLYAKDALSHALGRSLKSYNADHMTRTFPPHNTLPVVLPDYVTTTTRSYPKYSVEEMRNADPFYALK